MTHAGLRLVLIETLLSHAILISPDSMLCSVYSERVVVLSYVPCQFYSVPQAAPSRKAKFRTAYYLIFSADTYAILWATCTNGEL